MAANWVRMYLKPAFHTQLFWVYNDVTYTRAAHNKQSIHTTYIYTKIRFSEVGAYQLRFVISSNSRAL